MTTAAAAAAGCLMVLGVIAVLAGAQRGEPNPQHSTSLWTTLGRSWTRLPRSKQMWVLAAFFLGGLAAALSGFVLATLLVPALMLGVPYLLGTPPAHEIELLAALDRWVRLLSSSIGTGKSIRDALFTTRAQAPAVLKPHVDILCARLDQQWSTKDALLAFADDLDSADGDAVAAALAIASARGGLGTQATLTALSNTIQDRLRALREVETERSKPRTVVRQVTAITLTVLIGAVLFNGRFFEPYRSGIGQLIALGLAVAYAGCLVILRKKSIPAPAPRFLRA